MGIDSKGVTPDKRMNQVTFVDISVPIEDSVFNMLAQRFGLE